MRKLLFCLVLSGLLAAPALSPASSRSMCKEKVLGTETVEGVYSGTICGDFCYSTIKLKNGEEFTFLCGEEEAERYFGAPGSQVSVTVELQQFWNEFGNLCAREQVCRSGRVLQAGFSFDACMEKAEGRTFAMMECFSQEQAIMNKKLEAAYAKTMSELERQEDKEALKAARQAWSVWNDKMGQVIFARNGTGSLSRLLETSFGLRETQRFIKLLEDKEYSPEE